MLAASPRSSSGSHKSNTRTARPASTSLRVITNPSPPLFPLPQTMLTRSAPGYSESAKRATTAPAFSIKLFEGTPTRSQQVRVVAGLCPARLAAPEGNRTLTQIHVRFYIHAPCATSPAVVTMHHRHAHSDTSSDPHRILRDQT